MSEILIGLGAFGVLLTGVWLYSVRLLQAELEKNRTKSGQTSAILEKISEMTSPDLDFTAIEDRMADLMQDLIQDTMSNMQMPTATDHIMGAIANIVQHKFTSSLPPALAEMMPSLNEGEVESFEHGQAQTE
jgi:hypothetical protein